MELWDRKALQHANMLRVGAVGTGESYSTLLMSCCTTHKQLGVHSSEKYLCVSIVSPKA